MSNLKIARYISYILRHNPQAVGLILDEHGWANVSELIEGVNKTYPFSMEVLEQIVKTNDKKRFSCNGDKTLIRANYGHSIPVNVELLETEPPEFLYHGTAEKFEASINRNGLISKSRLYVHMSIDEKMAFDVGSRHGIPILYRVFSMDMFYKVHKFFKPTHNIWLTKSVPSEFLEKIIVFE